MNINPGVKPASPGAAAPAQRSVDELSFPHLSKWWFIRTKLKRTHQTRPDLGDWLHSACEVKTCPNENVVCWPPFILKVFRNSFYLKLIMWVILKYVCGSLSSRTAESFVRVRHSSFWHSRTTYSNKTVSRGCEPWTLKKMTMRASEILPDFNTLVQALFQIERYRNESLNPEMSWHFSTSGPIV